MYVSVKTISLMVSVFLTGLSAGLFYGWSVSVIPGTQRLSDGVYLETMQSINRAIINPAFFIVFFGSVIAFGVAGFNQWNYNKVTFWLILSAFIIYLIGTIGVTGLGNVPLNNKLDALHLYELNADKMKEFRDYYEVNWNRLHQIRTICTVLSFVLGLVAVFIQIKK